MSSRVVLTVRSLLLVAAGAGGWLALLRGTAGLRHPDGSFESLLLAGAAWLLTACAAWAGLAVATVLVEVWSAGRLRPGRRACPPPVRRAALLALGLALASGTGVPAALASDAGGAAAGTAPSAGTLPVPARAVSTAPGRPTVEVVVRRGDTLWALVAGRLPRTADAAAVDAAVRRAHRANRTVIGPDPDHLEPGQHLRLPGPGHHPTSEENP